MEIPLDAYELRIFIGKEDKTFSGGFVTMEKVKVLHYRGTERG